MTRPAIGLYGGIVLLTASLAAASGQAAEPAGGLAALVEIAPPADAISPRQRAAIRAAIAAYEKRKGTGPAQRDAAEGPFLYPFFPHAGILGRDLQIVNFTDQDPSQGLIRDWDCTDYTYDGHHGHDSLIRSFREQAIGVPVFAARDGLVVATHDGEPDTNIEWVAGTAANYVVMDHGGGHFAFYYHLRRGSVAVSPGQAVTAGTQLGLTGSSGFSNWPHLHFETWKAGTWLEPSAGPCRTGESLWLAQPPVMRDFYVADFFMSRGRIEVPNREALLFDRAERTATFVRGFQTVGQRLDLRNLPAGATFVQRVVNPRGKVAFESAGSFTNPALFRLALGVFWFDLDLDMVGTWRFRLEIDGRVAVDAPFRVVATGRQVINRPPGKVRTRLVPQRPAAGEVVTCEILQTSLVIEDPDYDIVSYRYEWRVNGRPVRVVTSAALTDLLPAGAARPQDRVSCRVVPSDGRARGQATVAIGIVEDVP